MFNALGSLDVLADATVADLFAGSGALGIEALSRGARHCTFVDRDRAAIAALRANLAHVGFESSASVRATDVDRALTQIGAVDVVFIDPPYAFDAWTELLARLETRWVIIESNRSIDLGERWEVVRERAYGGTVVTFAKSAGLGALNHTGVSP
jgi:16S rRNA (guanine966-N2)-methyltransferase